MGLLRLKNHITESAFSVGHNKSDNSDVQKLISFLQGSGNDDIVMVSNGDESKFKIKRVYTDRSDDIKTFIKDKGLNIPFASIMFGDGSIGEGGKKIPTEVQEMMTACLVILGKKHTTLNQEDAIQLIDDAKGVFSKINGADRRPDFLEHFSGNFNDLASAISASNYILSEVKNVSKIYWTGKGWVKEIAHFNPKLGNIKDYNSSDMVVKDGSGKFFGYSLKKKLSSKSPDPTLINKPITGKSSILRDIVGGDVVLIENAKTIFFNKVMVDRLGLSLDEVKKMKPRERSQAISSITAKDWGIELKKPTNIFFKKVEAVIKSHDRNFVEKFLELVFRTELSKTLDAKQFKFTLLTGIGRYVRKQVEIEDAVGHELITIVDNIQRLYNSNLTVKRTVGKIGAWEKGAGAAKVFISILSDGASILDIEVRYKGSYSAEPQFQAMATANFKKIFK